MASFLRVCACASVCACVHACARVCVHVGVGGCASVHTESQNYVETYNCLIMGSGDYHHHITATRMGQIRA